MDFPVHFIQAGREFNTLEKHVPAPYFRKEIYTDKAVTARVLIAACGFYELYINGINCTKGPLAPYISNTDDIVYYDSYELPLKEGNNAVGILLGNGFQNNPGGYIWDFDKAVFRGAPSFAMSLTWQNADGSTVSVQSDNTFRTRPSPVTFDDYRFGEHYDARLETDGWALPGFDDSGWEYAVSAPAPRGEARLCEAEPIAVTREIKPLSVTPSGDGFLYDFGENCAGVCRLFVNGAAGQQIELLHGEWVKEDGTLDIERVWFHRDEALWQRDKKLVHRDIYTCRGGKTEIYTPRFTYHGFRYVLVSGITASQATEELLTYLVMNSDIKERGGFCCSDETVNKLFDCTRRSDLANFYYFPTDCPHREKNGWTADAALSAEHMIINLDVKNSYREWMRNICKAQKDDGSLPGIIPTGGWGFKWGNGPAWDCVLAYLPYYVYVYCGETDMIKESAGAFMLYLHYLTIRTDSRGLLKIGLGDWCHVDRQSSAYVAPLEFTDTVIASDIARKMEVMFDAVGMTAQRDFAHTLAVRFKNTVREQLVDWGTFTAAGSCQTSQAMAIFYDIFEPGEKSAAFSRLMSLIEEKNGRFDVGVLGARVLFHVLAQFGQAELAFKMIVGPGFPSYGFWLENGATSLWENFRVSGRTASRNHHFWGDIGSWFIRYLSGIRLNPLCRDVNRVDIAPCFVGALKYAKGFHIAPAGRISSEWERAGDRIILTVEAPAEMSGYIRSGIGYSFDDGLSVKPLCSGTYTVVKNRS